MPLPILQDEPSYDSWMRSGDLLENTAQDAAAASYDQGAESGLTNDFFRRNAIKELEAQGGKVLTPQELNQKYGGEGLIFKEPTSALVAEYLASDRRERMAREDRIGMGPDGLFSFVRNRILNQGVGAFSHDPVGYFLYAAGGALLGPLAGVGSRLGVPGAAQVASNLAAKETIKGVLTRAIGTGAIAGIPQTALEEYQKSVEQNDIHATGVIADYVNSVALNSAFDVGIHFLGKGLKLGAGKGWNWFAGSNDSAGRDAFNLAIEQAWANKRPNASIISALIERERTGGIPQDVQDFSGRTIKGGNIDENGNASGKFFYGTNSTRESFAEVDPTSIKPFEKNFGDGYYVTEDVARANNFAASKFNANQGNIYELGVNNAKVLHADQHFPNDLEYKVKSLLVDSAQDPQTKADIKKIFEDGATVSQIFDGIHSMANEADASAIIKKINEDIVKRAGYDGYAMNSNGRNELMLFDSAKVEHKGTYTPDPKVLPDNGSIDERLQQNYNNEMNAPSSNLFQSERMDAAVNELSQRAELQAADPLSDPFLKAEHDAAMEQAKVLIESGKLSPEDAQLLKDISAPTTVDKGEGAGAVTNAKGNEVADKIRAIEAAIKSAIPCVDK